MDIPNIKRWLLLISISSTSVVCEQLPSVIITIILYKLKNNKKYDAVYCYLLINNIVKINNRYK